VISSFVNLEQLRQFEEHLRQIKDVRIAWTGGSADEGPIIAISLQKPLQLMFLNEIPLVEKAYKEGGRIVVRLSNPVGN